jgi:hypothetical protein
MSKYPFKIFLPTVAGLVLPMFMICAAHTALAESSGLQPGGNSKAESKGESSKAESKTEASKLEPAQKPQLVAGTRILLVEPTGFEPSPTFSGFVDPNGRTSILVTEVPAPFSKFTGGFNSDILAAKGIKLIVKQDIKIDSYPALLMQAAQSAGGQDFRKWITVFGDDKESVMITATIPENHPDLDKISESLKKIVMHPVWKREVNVDKFANLLFSLDVSAPFKFAERLQNSLLYTIDGKLPQADDNDPLFVVGQSLGVTPSSDKKEFALARIKKTLYMTDIKEESVEPIELSGLQGYQIKASATDSKTKKPVHICQTMLFGSKVYYIVQAITPKSKLSKYSDAFDKMTKSLKLQP